MVKVAKYTEVYDWDYEMPIGYIVAASFIGGLKPGTIIVDLMLVDDKLDRIWLYRVHLETNRS